jgi:hypothetical protein
MFWILIFFLALALVMFLTRTFALRMHLKLTAPKVPRIKNTGEGIDEELIAVITAAVESTFKKQIVVRTVRFIGQEQDLAWIRSGRLNQMTSHAVPVVR